MPRLPVTHVIFDTHLNHDKIATYCDRPEDFTDLIIKNWKARVLPIDTVIHGGDVIIGNKRKIDDILAELPGKKILVRGNHDWKHSCDWWVRHGFDFACDAMIYRGVYITHKPASVLPAGANFNLHGHLHNIWHGFAPDGDQVWRCPKGDYTYVGEGEGKKCPNDETPLELNKQTPPTTLYHPWQRLFAVEYTGYSPIEFNHFMSHPDKYHARGLRGNNTKD